MDPGCVWGFGSPYFYSMLGVRTPPSRPPTICSTAMSGSRKLIINPSQYNSLRSPHLGNRTCCSPATILEAVQLISSLATEHHPKTHSLRQPHPPTHPPKRTCINTPNHPQRNQITSPILTFYTTQIESTHSSTPPYSNEVTFTPCVCSYETRQSVTLLCFIPRFLPGFCPSLHLAVSKVLSVFWSWVQSNRASARLGLLRRVFVLVFCIFARLVIRACGNGYTLFRAFYKLCVSVLAWM